MQGITLALALFFAQDYRYSGGIGCEAFSRCMAELEAFAAGGKIVATTVYLSDIADYTSMNEAYERSFQGALKPARNTVQVKLPAGQRMAIQATIYTGRGLVEGLTPPNVKNVAPITPAIRTPEKVFIAGILGRDSNTGAVPSTAEAQVEMCLARHANVLATARLAPSQVENATIFHTKRIPRPAVELALTRFFGPVLPLAVTILEVPALALGAQVGLHGTALNRDYASDVLSVDSTVKALYDVISGPAGQARDWDRFRYLFHSQARFQTVRPQGGVLSITPEEYAGRNAKALVEQGFFETETSRRVETFEGIAHVWSGFAIRRSADTPILRTGINSIQLYWDRTRWWVLSVLWDNAR